MKKINYSTILATVFGLSVLVWASCKKDKTPAPTTPTQDATIRPITASSNAYVTQLFDFNPAPGQFINTGLGDTTAAMGTLKTDQGLVSLGAWGGYIITGFDHTVKDKDGSPDFVVYGNAFSLFA